jgi:rhodanese-related sulfurtransferase
VLVIIFSWVTFYVLRSKPDVLCGCFGGLIDMTFSRYHFIVLFIVFILNLILVVEPSDTWTLQKVFRTKVSAAKKMLLLEILLYFLIAVGIILIGFAIYMNFWGQQGGQEAEIRQESEIPGVINIDVDEAYNAYLADEGFIFVDVRSESEYASGHIKGAVLIPLSELEERFNELPKDKPIVVYCNGSSCNRSGAAARILVAQGFEIVYDLTGKGIDEWIAKGYPSE